MSTEALSFILSERGNIFIADSLTVKTGMLEMYHCPTLKFLLSQCSMFVFCARNNTNAMETKLQFKDFPIDGPFNDQTLLT